MALRCNRNHSQNPCFWQLLVAWILISFTSCSESADQRSFSGVIGGNVTFPCPVNKEKTIQFFYVQREDKFVNGYYSSKTIPENTKWENTWVDRSESTVHMYGLNISHIGNYECYVQYSDDSKLVITVINLSVTANYSKPTVTTVCKEENRNAFCTVTCASHGGYPQADMRFELNADGNSSHPMWNVEDSRAPQDPDTMLFDSSSTAHFNCSNGEVTHIRCSVGEATSKLFSVCKPAPPTPDNLAAIIAVCSVVAVMIIVVLWLCKHNKRKAGTAECTLNGPAQDVLLKQFTVGEAP